MEEASIGNSGVNITAIAQYLRVLQEEIYLSNSVTHPEQIQYRDGTLQIAQRPDMHAMTVHDHMIAVGTLASDLVNLQIAEGAKLAGEVYEIFGSNQPYLDRLTLPVDADSSEAVFRRHLYFKFKKVVQEQPLEYEDKLLTVLTAYLHDYEKVFNSELRSPTGKFENSAYGIIDPDSEDEVDDQSKLTLNLFRSLAEEGFIPDTFSQRLIAIYGKYLALTNYVKGIDHKQPDINLQDRDQTVALILLFSDELGKGIEFTDNSKQAIVGRLDKLRRLEKLLSGRD